MTCVVPELHRSQRHHGTRQSRDLNVHSGPIGDLDEDVFGHTNDIGTGAGGVWESIELDDGSIDEACESVKSTRGNIPKGILMF